MHRAALLLLLINNCCCYRASIPPALALSFRYEVYVRVRKKQHTQHSTAESLCIYSRGAIVMWNNNNLWLWYYTLFWLERSRALNSHTSAHPARIKIVFLSLSRLSVVQRARTYTHYVVAVHWGKTSNLEYIVFVIFSLSSSSLHFFASLTLSLFYSVFVGYIIFFLSSLLLLACFCLLITKKASVEKMKRKEEKKVFNFSIWTLRSHSDLLDRTHFSQRSALLSRTGKLFFFSFHRLFTPALCFSLSARRLYVHHEIVISTLSCSLCVVFLYVIFLFCMANGISSFFRISWWTHCMQGRLMLRHSLMHLDCLTLLHNFLDNFLANIVRCLSSVSFDEMNSVCSVNFQVSTIVDIMRVYFLSFQKPLDIWRKKLLNLHIWTFQQLTVIINVFTKILTRLFRLETIDMTWISSIFRDFANATTARLTSLVVTL